MIVIPDEIFDIAVIGSGFAGSLMAMVAARLKLTAVLVERNVHPRFAIGESSTPLSNLLLDEIAHRYDLPALKPLTKWGTWQREYPHVGCGLKRGFSFFHHDLNAEASAQIDLRRQLLVAASPHDEIGDTHWFRADFDELFVREARKLGIVYEDEVKLQRFDEKSDYVCLSGDRRGTPVAYRARFVIDASGPRGGLHQLLGISDAPPLGYPRTQALYSHFRGVKSLEKSGSVASSRSAPYPIDDAAVHHVFDGGWIWVLQFSNGITSAGVAACDRVATALGLARGETAWKELIARIPALRDQFEAAEPAQTFRHVPCVCFQSGQTVGRRWAMLPSASGFVDPLLSTGFPLALSGVARMGEILSGHWKKEDFAEALQNYGDATAAEFTQTANLIAALYANMNSFKVFRAITFLYFAAASYSETARRLGKSERAKSFLLHDDPDFGPASARLLTTAQAGIAPQEADNFINEVEATIAPFDVAGLTRSRDLPYYPVDVNDLYASAWKLDATREDVTTMLERSGFYAAQKA